MWFRIGPRQLLFGATMAMDGSSAVVVASAALGDGRLLFGVAALHGGADADAAEQLVRGDEHRSGRSDAFVACATTTSSATRSPSASLAVPNDGSRRRERSAGAHGGVGCVCVRVCDGSRMCVARARLLPVFGHEHPRPDTDLCVKPHVPRLPK